MKICLHCTTQYPEEKTLPKCEKCQGPVVVSLVGSVLRNKYHIQAILGYGATSVVYKALDNISRWVAIKVFIDSSTEFARRFKNDARAAGRLSHPNIITVHSYDTRTDGTPYIVMECVAGVSLDKYLLVQGAVPVTKRALPTQEVAALLEQICAGVGESHRAGVIHRDLKPPNIMLPLDADGKPLNGKPLKVLDFGLAKLLMPGTASLNQSHASSVFLSHILPRTAIGLYLGTPHYSAPEQWEDSTAVTPAADIYSLGVILYEMLTGRVPFEGNNLIVLAGQHIHAAPPPLNISPAIDAVVLKALAKKPTDRQASAEELAQEFLKAVGIKPPSGARPSSSPQTSQPPLNRELIRIPAGEAILGARPELISHLAAVAGQRFDQLTRPALFRKTLAPFAILRYAVTNREYLEFVEKTGHSKPKHWPENLPAELEPLPVVNVTFADAETFCQWKDVRLPTNDEWERAARGTDGRAYPWGNTWQANVANTLERHQATRDKLLPAASLESGNSPDGLRQMAGNVWEWVDGGAEGKKHTRGGSWRYNGEMYALTWFRLPSGPAITDDDVGFRYVQSEQAQIPTLQMSGNAALTAQELKSLATVPAATYRLGVTPEELRGLAEQAGLSSAQLQKLQPQTSRATPLAQFQMRRYLVTNEEYYEFVQRTGHTWPAHWSRQLLAWSDRPFLSKYRYHPVTQVNYRDATAFCQWQGGRLPSTDEWEAAARGPNGSLYPWGQSFDATRCNMSETGLARTTAVNNYPDGKSAFGCYDLAGNVSEWAGLDVSGSFVVRGGSYEDAGAHYGLAFCGIEANPGYVGPEVGFRYVIT